MVTKEIQKDIIGVVKQLLEHNEKKMNARWTGQNSDLKLEQHVRTKEMSKICDFLENQIFFLKMRRYNIS